MLLASCFFTSEKGTMWANSVAGNWHVGIAQAWPDSSNTWRLISAGMYRSALSLSRTAMLESLRLVLPTVIGQAAQAHQGRLPNLAQAAEQPPPNQYRMHVFPQVNGIPKEVCIGQARIWS